MAIAFSRARAVLPGADVSAGDLVSLANAINGRILSGLGDWEWRVHWWMHSAARQIQNPSDTGAFPPLSEAQEVYAHIKPADTTWPIAGPGESEGINTASLMGAFVYGNDSAGIDEEAVRIAEPPAGVPIDFDGVPPRTAWERWQLYKLQRGAFDVHTGAVGSPAFTAARSHLWIRQSSLSAHGQNWGGYYPTPVTTGDCGDGTTEIPPTPDRQVFFTRLSDRYVKSYPGTCPTVPGNVAAVLYWPDYYVVIVVGGPVDFLRVDQWIEGPYSGGSVLRRSDGGHLPRILNHFAAEFRGSATQRAEEDSGQAAWTGNSFDFLSFWSNQYGLAPQRGRQAGTSVAPEYARLSIAAIGQYVRRGAYFPAGGGYYYQIKPGVLGHSWVVRAVGLKGDCTVDAMVAGEVVSTITISSEDAPAPGTGKEGSGIAVFEAPLAPGTQVAFRVRDEAFFSGTTKALYVEVAELQPYKPGAHDLYLVLRLSGSVRDTRNGTDGYGLDEESAAELGTYYFGEGGVLNLNNASAPGYDGSAINTSAIWESYRRMLESSIRMVPQQMLLGYAVENGNSVVYFKRKYFTGDVWDGLLDIRSVAPKGGWTNEWVFNLDLKTFSSGGSSIYRPDTFSYQFPFSNRCLFYNPSYPSAHPVFRNQFGYGQALWQAPEAPTGYNYARYDGFELNRVDCDVSDAACIAARLARYKSCRIYEAPLMVKSIQAVDWTGAQAVKVTLVGRLHHHPTAPGAISADISTWDLGALQTEVTDYRTLENGIREGVLYASTGRRCGVPGAPGNTYAGSSWWEDDDGANGACLGTFRLTKLIERPHLDGNTNQDVTDSPFRVDPLMRAETYLHIGAPGWVDGRTSEDTGCSSDVLAVYDFAPENLWFQAAGTRWALAMPSRQTQALAGSDLRPERPQGFGPLPTFKAAAETVNLLASAVNLLNRVRVMIPMQFQTRPRSGTKTISVSANHDCSARPVCPGSDFPFWTGVAPDPGTVPDADWSDADSASSGVGCRFVYDSSNAFHNPVCDGSNWLFAGDRSDSDYRWRLTDPDALNAIPESWRDMLTTNGTLLCSSVEVSTTYKTKLSSDPAGAFICEVSTPIRVNGKYLVGTSTAPPVTRCFVPAVAGTLHVEALGMTPAWTWEVAAGGGYQPFNTANQRSLTLTPVGADAIILNVPVVTVRDVT